MSRSIKNENDDGMASIDKTDSPSMDEGSCGGSSGPGVLKKGPWTSAEDAILVDYVKKHGEGNWNAVQKHSGLMRCGKSCRLRWANHLRPNLKKGAFTPEEECLIIELHAKLGNKWARMAGHLPGRTDNEIKNYWNTRIKRRQRAGLPIYPPDVGFQTINGQQSLNVNDLSGSDVNHNDLLQTNGYDIPDVVFDNLKAPQGPSSYAPPFDDISGRSILVAAHIIGSPQNYNFMPPIVHHAKRPHEPDTLFPNFLGSVTNALPSYDPVQMGSSKKIHRPAGLEFPYDPDSEENNLALFSDGTLVGSHALSNGNFSSSKTLSRVVKMELPSLQYSDADLSWGTCPPPIETGDAHIQSPPAMQVHPDCPSPWNSGLLEEVIQGPHARNQSSEKSSTASIVTPADAINSSTLELREAEWVNYEDPISPLGCSVASLFSECTPISGTSLDESLPIKTLPEPDGGEKEISSTQLDFSRPDVLLGSDCFEQSSDCTKDLVAFLSEDFYDDCKHATSGSSLFTQGWELGSCVWDNMPAVCQMSDNP